MIGAASRQSAHLGGGERTPGDFTVVSRLLWPGTGRVALEEARRLPARLLAYRQSATPLFYDLTGVDLAFLRRLGERGRFTSVFEDLTMRFYSGRGVDATVDLDLIARATSKIHGPALFHDQFAGLTGLLRKFRSRSEYAVYLHETALGDSPGVRATGSQWANRALRRFDRTVLEQANLVLTNSRRNASILREEGIESEVLYAGCDPIPQLPDHRERILLATTVWDRIRNPEVYVELARKIQARIVLAGTWGRVGEMWAFQRRYGDQIDVTGPISEEGLNELSRRASVYLRFGFGERGPGQGGIQAMAFGLPVITNRDLAMAELVEDGVNGFIVGSVDEAADRVNSLLSSEPIRRKMSEAAWYRSQQLSWDTHVVRLRALISRAFH